jgi:hypothetical protein
VELSPLDFVEVVEDGEGGLVFAAHEDVEAREQGRIGE